MYVLILCYYMSYKYVWIPFVWGAGNIELKCPKELFHKYIKLGCPKELFHKYIKLGCPKELFHKYIKLGCPKELFHKYIKLGCPKELFHKYALKVSFSLYIYQPLNLNVSTLMTVLAYIYFFIS